MRTMGNLIQVLVMLCGAALVAGPAIAKEPQYVGSSKCGVCHKQKVFGRQLAVWKAGPHAKAYDTLDSDRAYEFAEARGLEDDPQESAECLKCHVTGYGEPATRFRTRKPIVADGVGCESCHGAGSMFQNEDTMSDLELAKSKGLKLPGDADCRQCHNDESPAWDPSRYTLADGSHAGFDFEQAAKLIAHPIPPESKGHVLEIKAKLKAGK